MHQRYTPLDLIQFYGRQSTFVCRMQETEIKLIYEAY